MENASKALLIAGGVLLAMMILALAVYVFTAMGGFAESQDRKKLTEQIEAFNNSYLAYNKSVMYGTDVLTVSNKAEENNLAYKDNLDYCVDVKAINKDGNEISIENTHDFKVTVLFCITVSAVGAVP